jgi:hypothetical protein
MLALRVRPCRDNGLRAVVLGEQALAQELELVQHLLVGLALGFPALAEGLWQPVEGCAWMGAMLPTRANRFSTFSPTRRASSRIWSPPNATTASPSTASKAVRAVRNSHRPHRRTRLLQGGGAHAWRTRRLPGPLRHRPQDQTRSHRRRYLPGRWELGGPDRPQPHRRRDRRNVIPFPSRDSFTAGGRVGRFTGGRRRGSKIDPLRLPAPSSLRRLRTLHGSVAVPQVRLCQPLNTAWANRKNCWFRRRHCSPR